MASLAIWLGRIAIVGFLVGPLLAYLGVLPPIGGFAIFGVGVLCSLLGTIIGLIALLRGPASSRGAVLSGFVPALAVLVVTAFLASRGGNVPRINDITTDTANPPQFVHALTLPGNQDRDMAYPGESFASQQQAGYPDLAPLRLKQPPDEAFSRAQLAARSMPGWTITREDSAAHAIEGTETSNLFRFVDDFVIEVRPADGGSVVQMRSKSRVGKGDVGANAKRIKAYFAKLGS